MTFVPGLPRVIPLAMLLAGSLVLSCTISAQEADLPGYVIEAFGAPPPVPEGPLPETLQSAVKTAFIDSAEQSTWSRDQSLALAEIAVSRDPRLAWIVADLMRFAPGQRLSAELSAAATELLGLDPSRPNHWGVVTDHLIAWDIPAPPD